MLLTDVKAILTRKFRGATLDDIQGLSDYSLFKEAAGLMQLELDSLETVRIGEITLYDGIYDYPAPADLKGKKIIDIRPQVDRIAEDKFASFGIEEFDVRKLKSGASDFTVEFRDGTKVLRVAKDLGGDIKVSSLDDDSGWTVTGGASNLAEDATYKTEGSASLRFNVGATGGGIVNSTLSAIDLSNHENISSLFVDVYLPDASIVTSVTLRIGSDGSSYFERTVTTPHIGAFKNGWNTVRFDWNGMTESGTTVTTGIDYVLLSLVTTSDDTDIRVDNLRSVLPQIWQMPYYSRYLFRDATSSAFKETPTADTDIVNLESPADNIFVYECIRLISLQLQGDKSEDYVKYTNELYGTSQKIGMYERYRLGLPSETKLTVTSYFEEDPL